MNELKFIVTCLRIYDKGDGRNSTTIPQLIPISLSKRVLNLRFGVDSVPFSFTKCFACLTMYCEQLKELIFCLV